MNRPQKPHPCRANPPRARLPVSAFRFGFYPCFRPRPLAGQRTRTWDRALRCQLNMTISGTEPSLKTSFTIVALSLVLFGCGRRDAQLQKEIVGNWTLDGYFQMSLSPDGRFVSHWTTTNTSVTYQGTWKIQRGSMVSTLTNCIADGTTNYERVGSVDGYKIIRVDSTGLVYSNNNQLISMTRK